MRYWALLIFVPFFFFSVIPSQALVARGKVVVLKTRDTEPYNLAVQGMREVLTDSLKIYDMRGNPEEGRKFLQEAKEAGADLVISVGLIASQAAMEEQNGLPFVFAMVFLREDLARAGHATGVFLNIPVKNQFLLLKRALPQVRKVGALYDPRKSGRQIEEAREIARELGLELVAAAVSSEREVPKALREIVPKINALWMLPDSTVTPNEDAFRHINEEITVKNRMPLLVFHEGFVKEGALLGLSPDFLEIGRQVGRMAGQVLKGVPVSQIPRTFPEKLKPVVNWKTAQKIGVTFPPSVLEEAKIIDQ